MIGQRLHQYVIDEKLGEGGMGVVWKAKDTRLDRVVALKVLPVGQNLDRGQQDRFLREAKSASALNHPNIVTIYEIDRDGDVDFIAMEYVRGETLATTLESGPLPLDKAIPFVNQLADAMACAHAAGIVHRDLKPGNIMISHTGVLKVLDFGLAKKTGREAPLDSDSDTTANTLTAVGTTVGTPAYMSPEQAIGATVDARSDVFSFAVVVYEMITGVHPFRCANVSDTLFSLHHTEPAPLSSLQAGAPAALSLVVAKALQKRPEQRFRDMVELISTLKQGHAGVSKRVAIRKRPLVLAFVAILMLIVVMIGFQQLGTRDVADTVASPQTPADLSRNAAMLLERHDRDGNADQAVALLEKALQLDRAYATAYAVLAETYRQKYRDMPDRQWLRLATDAGTQAVTLNSDLAIAHVAHAFVAMEDGRSDEAALGFDRALELDPQNARARLGKALIHAAARRDAEAEKEFQAAVELKPSDWRAYSDFGNFLYRRARYSDAATIWEKGREATPDNAVIFKNLAAAYHQLGRYDDAAAVLQRALEIKPTASTYTNLGTTRFYQGRYSDSVAAFEKAVGLSAANALYWANLADAYRWSPGRRADSIPAYRRAIDLLQAEITAKPDDVNLLSRMAVYLAKSGDTKGTEEYLKKLANTSALRPEVLVRLATIHEIQGERTQAVAALDRALEGGYPLREINNEPEFLALRTDVLFQKLLAKKR